MESQLSRDMLSAHILEKAKINRRKAECHTKNLICPKKFARFASGLLHGERSGRRIGMR